MINSEKHFIHLHNEVDKRFYHKCNTHNPSARFHKSHIFLAMNKGLLFVLLLIFLSPFTLFAMSKKGKKGKDSYSHGKDILYVLYGYTEERKLTLEEKKAYHIINDAVAFAIDEQGNGKTKPSYDKFKQNVYETRLGAGISLPDYSEFISTGGGKHRAYNHQGFYWDYRDEEPKYLERWELGRDRILIPAVSAAFDIPIGDYRAEALAIIFYYIHMVGDLYEGKNSSIGQLGPIQRHALLLSQFQSDEEKLLSTNYGTPRNIFMDEPMNNAFKRIRRSASHAHSRESAYILSRRFFRRDLQPFIRSLLNN